MVKVKGKLEKTKWGMALNLAGTELESFGEYAFLDQSKNYLDYNSGEEYCANIFFRIMYTEPEIKDGQEKETNNKEWRFFDSKDIEKIFDFIERKSGKIKNVKYRLVSKKDISIVFE